MCIALTQAALFQAGFLLRSLGIALKFTLSFTGVVLDELDELSFLSYISFDFTSPCLRSFGFGGVFVNSLIPILNILIIYNIKYINYFKPGSVGVSLCCDENSSSSS